MQQCARDYALQFPMGAQHILESVYVDDLLTGADSINDAIELRSQLINLLEKGNFELAKWCSNSNKINELSLANPTVVEINDETIKSVLGLSWLPSEDVLTFRATAFPNERKWTKRKVISCIGKLYDPNGFISPIVVMAKMLIQSLWRSVTEWDNEIDEKIKKQ